MSQLLLFFIATVCFCCALLEELQVDVGVAGKDLSNESGLGELHLLNSEVQQRLPVSKRLQRCAVSSEAAQSFAEKLDGAASRRRISSTVFDWQRSGPFFSFHVLAACCFLVQRWYNVA